MKILLKLFLSLSLLTVYTITSAQDIFDAIWNGDHATVKQLITEQPALLDSMVKYECTPLMWASYCGKDTIVDFLLKEGADMYKHTHKNGRIAIHFTALRNHKKALELLINNGINVDTKDSTNNTALIYAIENNSQEIIDLLQKSNAKLPDDKEKMNICFHAAILYNLNDIADKLLNKGASLKSNDKFGRSLLHNAVIGNNLKWIDLLIENNAELNKTDSFLRTPLHYAVESNNFEVVKKLVDHGSAINTVDNTNRTPLNIANGLMHKEVADFLKSIGAITEETEIITIPGDNGKQSEIKITYIANMGVMISSKNKTVLIDALFNETYGNYLTPTQTLVNSIKNGTPPFHSVDLFLVTHNDGDHFSGEMVAEFLTQNKTAKVICNTVSAKAIIQNDSIGFDTARVIGILPNLFSSANTVANDVSVKLLRLRHSGKDDENDNLGFVIDFDGIKVFHQGDAGGEVDWKMPVKRVQEYDSIGIANMGIDVVILNRGSVWDSNSPGIEIIKKQIKPKHIVLGHFSDYNKQGEWETVDQTLRENKDIPANPTLFKWQMQDLIIRKGH